MGTFSMSARYLMAISVVLTVFFSQTLFAQDKSELDPESTAKSKAYWKAGADVVTNNVYLGRADSGVTQVYIPSLTYNFKWGLYLTGSAEYIPNRSENKLDGATLGIGYSFTLAKNLEGSVSWSKSFYASTSTQISSSISSTTNASLDYNIAEIVTISISADFNKGVKESRNDILTNPTLSHDFVLENVGGEEHSLIITPTAGVNAGTQNFYDSDLKKAKGKRAKAINARLAAYSVTLSKYTLLDEEFSLPVTYSLKPILFSVTPNLALPQNKLAKILTAGQDKRSSLVYVDFGISIKF